MLEDVQRVEFTSSPDGPYQFLCIRHDPYTKVTERIDIKDPADLRPGITGIYLDQSKSRPICYSMISSEEQAVQLMMDLLEKEGLMDGASADKMLMSDGMISRFKFDEEGVVQGVEFIDRYGNKVPLEQAGTHFKFASNRDPSAVSLDFLNRDQPFQSSLFLEQFFKVLNQDQLDSALNALSFLSGYKGLPTFEVIKSFTYLFDFLRAKPTGNFAKSSLLSTIRHYFFQYLDALSQNEDPSYAKLSAGIAPFAPTKPSDTLVINASNYVPEGTDELCCLSAALREAYNLGFRKFILYRVNGQRLISTATMGQLYTDDVEIHVYGIPGEYCGAFMQGGKVTVHNSAQNFTAMCMHHGDLIIYGNAGKVCGYGSKGGKVVILGDIVDRGWSNSVNDTRCQQLEVQVLGSASKYMGESLMGGNFFFGGLEFNQHGKVVTQARPIRGTKLFGGASRGFMLFFDPYNKIDAAQLVNCKVNQEEISDWIYWQEIVKETLELAGILVTKDSNPPSFEADGKRWGIEPDNFTLVTPKGGQKGYDSH